MVIESESDAGKAARMNDENSEYEFVVVTGVVVASNPLTIHLCGKRIEVTGTPTTLASGSSVTCQLRLEPTEQDAGLVRLRLVKLLGSW